MYAKFKWDFLNGKSKSHIDLTVGFNCIVCHIFKLFTNQHFNYSMCWRAVGQIKSSILKCCSKAYYPKITRLLLGSMDDWEKREPTFRSNGEMCHRRSWGVGCVDTSRPLLSPCDSAGLRQLPLHETAPGFPLKLVHVSLGKYFPSCVCALVADRYLLEQCIALGSLSPLSFCGIKIFPKFWLDLGQSQQPFVLPSPLYLLSLPHWASCPPRKVATGCISMGKEFLFFCK